MVEPTSLRSLTGPGPFAVPLRVTFSWTLLGYFAYAGCQWGIIVTLAKLGSAEMVGQYALGMTVTAPVVLFCSLQLRSVQVTDTTGQYRFADYLGLRLATSLLALLLVGVIVAAGTFAPRTAWIILAAGAAKAIDAVADIYAGLFQQHERMDRVAISQTLRGGTAVAAMAVVMAATHDLLSGVLATAVTSALVLFAFDIPNSRPALAAGDAHDGRGGTRPAGRPRWSLPVMTGLARTGLPLGMLILLLSLNSNAPSYVIGRVLGQAPLGVFAALAFLTMVPLTVVNALGQSASRRLARSYAAGDRRVFITLAVRLLLIAVALSLAATAGAALAGRPLLATFYTAEYAAQTPLFVRLMAAATLACVASVVGVALTATRCFNAQVPLGLLAAMVTLGVCLWLVPSRGLDGAVWGIVLSCAVQTAGLTLLLVRRLASPPTGDAASRGGDGSQAETATQQPGPLDGGTHTSITGTTPC
jgi:O-antigen/teichoic acid export membrane protein